MIKQFNVTTTLASLGDFPSMESHVEEHNNVFNHLMEDLEISPEDVIKIDSIAYNDTLITLVTYYEYKKQV